MIPGARSERSGGHAPWSCPICAERSRRACSGSVNHISGSRAGIAGVYQRHDWAAEKRAALDAWAAHVLAAAEGWSATGNVVALGRAG